MFNKSILLTLLGASSILAFPLEARAPAKQLVDKKLFPELVWYANYTAGYPVAPCKSPPHGSVVQGFANANTTDTEMTLFRDDSRKELVLSFPGTAELADFVTDLAFFQQAFVAPWFQCLFCQVHGGFQTAWKSIQPETTTILQTAIAKYPKYRLVVTGHSLGGAIAQLAYADLKGAGFNVAIAYTFGQPRVGNQVFANYIDQLSGASDSALGNFIRVTHANDGVPLLPPPLFGFVHSRNEIWESDGVNGTAPTAAATYRCFGQEPVDCVNSANGFFINEAHLGYAGLNYTGCN